MSEKNYDPQMHTAEHILNQTMVRLFECNRSYSNHIERKKSKCDYHFTRELLPEEEKTIEDKINEIINSQLPVSESFMDRVEAKQHFDLSRLPDETGDRVRIISVGEYDHCPCIGLHVANTREIGQFKMGNTTFEDGVLRIRFKLNRP